MNTAIVSSDELIPSEPEVFVVGPETPMPALLRFLVRDKKLASDERTWRELATISDWKLSTELHADEDPGDGYLRVNVPTVDPIADLALIRYEDTDWTVEFDRQGDARLGLDELANLGDEIHRAVRMANELNRLAAVNPPA